MPSVHGVVRWRLVDLVQWMWEEFRVSVSRQTLGRELNSLGYAKLSARPRHHAQNPEAMSAFKKTSRPEWRKSAMASHIVGDIERVREMPPSLIDEDNGMGLMRIKAVHKFWF